MPDDTAAAMAHLRESCAIAAGKVEPSVPARPRPRLEDELTGDPILVTCWEAGGWYTCGTCRERCRVLTDGRKLWVSCQACETVRFIP